MQYAISPSVKIRLMKRSPNRSMVAAILGMSVASMPSPMMFDMKKMILPTPGRAFAWRETPAGPALVCEPLLQFAAHLFTTRAWALGSQHPDTDLDAAWADVAAAMDVAPSHLARMNQVHGREIVAASPDSSTVAADIIVSDDPALALAVRVADCVPLLIVDPVSRAVAAAHAGWRGMAARVPETAVEAMTARFGSRREDLLVAAGPSIGACCYEVGADVRRAFDHAGFRAADVDRWFRAEPAPTSRNPSMPQLPPARHADHWFFDGWVSIRDQLTMAGVSADRIFSADWCTASHEALWCSYRRDGSGAGRLAGAVRPLPRRP